MQTMHIMVVLGTRPEAIKLAPVVKALRQRPDVRLTLCTTGQHREMVRQVLALFRLEPTIDLEVMTPGQSLAEVTTRVLNRLSDLLEETHVDYLVVQGDTTTAYAASLAAHYHKIPVAHVEAGLRSGNLYAPWPEEANRKMISAIAARHFAPTPESRDNLLREGCNPAAVSVTGNTVIDALHFFQRHLDNEPEIAAHHARKFAFLREDSRLILATGHRRENFDGGIEQICQALLELAARADVQIVYPVHPNPKVQEPVNACLSDHPNITLLQPQDYLSFVYLMSRAAIILTDSGGIQEEAPALGKPVLVTRDTTERPEGVTAGTARLVGAVRTRIVAAIEELLDNPSAYDAMSRAHNPYGDGHASERIVDALLGGMDQAPAIEEPVALRA